MVESAFKADDPYVLLIKFSGRKSGNFSLYQRKRYLWAILMMPMWNYFFREKCVNSVVDNIYRWISQHLVSITFHAYNTLKFAECFIV